MQTVTAIQLQLQKLFFDQLKKKFDGVFALQNQFRFFEKYKPVTQPSPESPDHVLNKEYNPLDLGASSQG